MHPEKTSTAKNLPHGNFKVPRMPRAAKKRSTRKDRWYRNINERYNAAISRKRQNNIGATVFATALSMKHRSSMELVTSKVKKQSLVTMEDVCTAAMNQCSGVQ